jgi:hypothetical protein
MLFMAEGKDREPKPAVIISEILTVGRILCNSFLSFLANEKQRAGSTLPRQTPEQKSHLLASRYDNKKILSL